MAEGKSTRRLTTIVATDVVGYSRLIAADEEGTLSALRAFRADLIDPKIKEYRGRIANTAGDSILTEFPSVGDALRCAVDIQRGMAERNTEISEDHRIALRVGINLGDVVEEGGDLLGDGVNVAARLETIAPPGGICVSEIVRDAIGSGSDLLFEDLGPQRLKNISKPIRAFLVSPETHGLPERQDELQLADQRNVRYCRSGDGVSIAHADVGTGYPLVFAGSWMTHLEKDWQSPMIRHFLTHLAKSFTLIRYDQRGSGMSDWDNVELTFEKMVDDLECVIDCYDYEKVAIFGASQAASVSIAYLMRRPEKVSHLILHGGYARGRRRRGIPDAAAESEALVTLIRQGWAAENPAFRQTITSLFMPDASPEEAAWFNDFQKTCAPAENMACFREMFDEMDVSDLLDDVKVPTLVIHCSDDSIAPLSEGKFLASRIAGAQFVMLKSKNHMIFENEPEFPRFIQSIRDFIK
jgi:class 3 adenylate cyclase/pimeloyl-ACP methyl ester carboxylesterase